MTDDRTLRTTEDAPTAMEGAREAAQGEVAAGGSEPDASDPYVREHQTFPGLTPEQAERVAAYGEVRDYEDGETLFTRGDRGADFFLVLEGAVEIVDLDTDGRSVVITTHAERQFTGELDLFNQRTILVSGRTKGPTRLARLDRARFRRMSSTEQDVGETMMRAFILRRTAFLVHDEAGVALIGDANGRDTIRIRRFLGRNGYPVRAMVPDGEDARAYASDCDLALGRFPVVRTTGGHGSRRRSSARPSPSPAPPRASAARATGSGWMPGRTCPCTPAP